MIHFCQDELNVLVNGLPFLEQVTLYARVAWRWVASVGRHL